MKFMISYALVIFKCRHEVQYTNELSHLHGCVIVQYPFFSCSFPSIIIIFPFLARKGRLKKNLNHPINYYLYCNFVGGEQLSHQLKFICCLSLFKERSITVVLIFPPSVIFKEELCSMK